MDLSKGLPQDKGYSARGIIARLDKCGNMNKDGLIVPIYRYLTLDCGAGREPIPVRLVGKAPIRYDEAGAYLDVASLKEGDIVVEGGLLYRKTEWSTAIRLVHAKAMKRYRPKNIVIAEAPDQEEEATNLGTIDLTKDKVALEELKNGKLLNAQT